MKLVPFRDCARSVYRAVPRARDGPCDLTASVRGHRVFLGDTTEVRGVLRRLARTRPGAGSELRALYAAAWFEAMRGLTGYEPLR